MERHGGDLSDEQLVARIGEGDSSAENQFAKQYRDRLLAAAMRRCGNRAAAEDFSQEALCIVLEKLRRKELKTPSALPSFAHTTVNNLWLNWRRRPENTRWQALPDEDHLQPASHHDELETAIRRQHQEVVRRFLADLRPPKYRRILYEHCLLGIDKEIICQRYGLSGRQFDNQIHRARRRFSETYPDALSLVRGDAQRPQP